MPQITTSGVTNAVIRLRDQTNGDEISLDVGMYERQCIVIQPVQERESPAEMKIVYANNAVRLFIRENDGRSFSVTLWDYAERQDEQLDAS